MPLKGHAYAIFPAVDKMTAQELLDDIMTATDYIGRVYIPEEDD